jgi:hypothetical protein
MPCLQRELEAISEMQEALWLRLGCAQIQVRQGMSTALAYEEAELLGDDKKESTAVAKGKKLDDQFKAKTPQKKAPKRGSSGGVKKCHICGGSSHMMKNCPKKASTSKS